jgi:tetratricopeptide (TPR) repeat protein
MKPFNTLLSALLGLSFLGAHAEARGQAQRGGGGGKAAANRGGGGGGAFATRSPATGSKIQRPTSRPAPKPAAKPASKPVSKPATQPAARPAAKPAVERPTSKPATQPGSRPQTLPGNAGNTATTKPGYTRPDNKPDGRPNADRPSTNKPATLPGMVSYPNRQGNGNTSIGSNNRGGNNVGNTLNTGNKTGINAGNNNRVGNNNLNIQGGDKTFKGGNKNTIHVDQVNVNKRNTALNRPATLPANKRNWNSNQWGGNKGVWGNNVNIGNDVNIKINNNFKYNNNFAYKPNYWGAKPWWGASNAHGWHHGHWNYGYNSYYYRSHWYFHDDNDFAEGFMWGIAVWSLGNMIYDMGYKSYSNPYPAPPVQNTTINYTQPVSVSAAKTPPGDEAASTLAETKSNEALDRSRAAFKQGDYLAASKAVDEAIAHTPGDVTLHEYRALVFFALGKYADATGVINPVLASGPGWGWDTLIAFYDSSSTYDTQLRKLEAYVKGSPDKADGHFLLGYHYLVCGHTAKAYEQFDKTATLQPADSIARQLRDLTKESLPVEGTENTPPPAPPAPVPTDKLVGNWVSDNGAQGKVTFAMAADGSFTWSYLNGDQSSELKGTYGLDDKGLLVLSMDDSQMVSEVTLPADGQMKFVIVGSPAGDPGLSFKKG